MKASPLPERRNAVRPAAQKKGGPPALPPRHDSTPKATSIHFFPGQNNYSGSQTMDAETTHKVSPKRKWVYVRARAHFLANWQMRAAFNSGAGFLDRAELRSSQ